MITVEQCRAARGLVGWTQQDLADGAGLSKTAINNFEKGHSDIKAGSLRAIQMAFEAMDVEFLEEAGLRLKTDRAHILKGPNALNHLMEDILGSFTHTQGELLIYNMSVDLATHFHTELFTNQLHKLQDNNISTRILSVNPHSAPDDAPMSAATYRALPDLMTDTAPTFFVYDGKIACAMTNNITITESHDASTSERQRFENLWNSYEDDTRQNQISKKS